MDARIIKGAKVWISWDAYGNHAATVTRVEGDAVETAHGAGDCTFVHQFRHVGEGRFRSVTDGEMADITIEEGLK